MRVHRNKKENKTNTEGRVEVFNVLQDNIYLRLHISDFYFKDHTFFKSSRFVSIRNNYCASELIIAINFTQIHAFTNIQNVLLFHVEM